MPDTQPATGLEWLDYVAVVAYLAVTLLILYRSGRKQHDTEDFFLAGRSMPWLAVGLSVMATLLSTNTYLGVPGEIIRYGPAYVLGMLAYPVPLIVVLVFWIPFFMRLRLTSAYDYLEQRYDRRARFLGTILFLGLRLGWMSMVLYGASKAMITMLREPLTAVAEFFGSSHPIYPVIIAVGLFATAFACLGGIRAVIWTDVLQAAMLFGGVAMIIGYVAWVQGGATTWWTTISATSENPPKLVWFSWDISERTTVLWAMLSIATWNICTNCCDQVALQRYFATTSLSAARKSFIVNIVSAAAISTLLAISGLALRYFYLQHTDRLPSYLSPASGADELMPYFYAYQLPAGFAGLILVSFLCDAMQTLASGVNSIAAVFTKDVARRASSVGEMLAARLVTLAVGLVATVLAVLAAAFAIHGGKTIIDMLPRMFNMFLGPLAVMFISGMFFRRATATAILPAVLIAQVFSIVWSWWGEVPYLLTQIGLDGAANVWTSILGVDGSGNPRTPSVFLAITVPALFGLAVSWLFSRLFGRDQHSGVEFTWKAVMRRSPLQV